MAVTPNGGVYDYSVSIVNNGPKDVVLVSLIDAPTFDALLASTLQSPAGYLSLYDSNLGIVDFLEDTSLFAVGATVGGFMFSSAIAPSPYFANFEALDVDGATIQGKITLVQRVPDDGSTLVLAALALTTLAGRRFLRRLASSSDRLIPTP